MAQLMKVNLMVTTLNALLMSVEVRANMVLFPIIYHLKMMVTMSVPVQARLFPLQSDMSFQEEQAEVALIQKI